MEQDRPGARAVRPSGLSVEAYSVRHRYAAEAGHVLAVDEVSLKVRRGEFVSILGPSGCGKSTLLLIISGLVKPTAGQVIIDGQPVTAPWTELGFVFQDPTLLEWRTVLRNILLQAEVRRMEKGAARERATTLMQSMGLRDFAQAYPSELSGGMRQRVALCRALLHDPPLLLMDEPFGALDSLTREQLVNDLQRIWVKDRKTVLFVTHTIDEAVFLSDRIAIMSPRPGKVAAVVDVDLPRPRTWRGQQDTHFRELVVKVREVLSAHGVLYE